MGMTNEFQNRILKTVVSCLNNGNFLVVDHSHSNISTPITVVGNIVQTLITGVAGQQIVIKGITISGEGDAGVSTVERENGSQVVILPLYQTKQSNTQPSSAMNLVLDDGESVIIRTVGRGVAEETFFGISYIILSCD